MREILVGRGRGGRERGRDCEREEGRGDKSFIYNLKKHMKVVTTVEEGFSSSAIVKTHCCCAPPDIRTRVPRIENILFKSFKKVFIPCNRPTLENCETN